MVKCCAFALSSSFLFQGATLFITITILTFADLKKELSAENNGENRACISHVQFVDVLLSFKTLSLSLHMEEMNYE